MSLVIQTHNLTKLYGRHLAVSDINLEVSEGEVFGYLGPNGAGKTTTIRTLLDFIRPTSGSATVFGLDTQQHAREIRRPYGYLQGHVPLIDGIARREQHVDVPLLP